MKNWTSEDRLIGDYPAGVEYDTLVDVKLGTGEVFCGKPAELWDWSDDEFANPIVAWDFAK